MAHGEEDGDGAGGGREAGEAGGRGAECSFKWKLPLSLMAAASNDDPLPDT